jgi:hypothetical protein
VALIFSCSPKKSRPSMPGFRRMGEQIFSCSHHIQVQKTIHYFCYMAWPPFQFCVFNEIGPLLFFLHAPPLERAIATGSLGSSAIPEGPFRIISCYRPEPYTKALTEVRNLGPSGFWALCSPHWPALKPGNQSSCSNYPTKSINPHKSTPEHYKDTNQL